MKRSIDYLFADSMYGFSGNDTPEKALQIASVRYALGSNQYQRYIKTDMAEDVTQKTMS